MHKPLENLVDLAHTVDERYVLSYLPYHQSTQLPSNNLPTAESLIVSIKNLIGEVRPHLNPLSNSSPTHLTKKSLSNPSLVSNPNTSNTANENCLSEVKVTPLLPISQIQHLVPHFHFIQLLFGWHTYKYYISWPQYSWLIACPFYYSQLLELQIKVYSQTKSFIS